MRTSRDSARKTSALWEGCPDSVRSMWPISCAMRPSRRPDSTARTDTNNVCEESFDFVAPMIRIPRGHFLERGFDFSGAAPPRTVHDGGEHGEPSRPLGIKVRGWPIRKTLPNCHVLDGRVDA